MYNQSEALLEQYDLDIKQITKGRGAYICNSVECLEKAIKNKRLEKCFEVKIDNKIYESLRGVIVDRK